MVIDSAFTKESFMPALIISNMEVSKWSIIGHEYILNNKILNSLKVKSGITDQWQRRMMIITVKKSVKKNAVKVMKWEKC